MILKHCTAVLRIIGSTQRTCAIAILRRQQHPLVVNNLLGHGRFYSSAGSNTVIGIVDYDFVKKLRNEPKKLLIDVREPSELQETGQIPSSINIPLGSVSQELGVSAQQFKSKYGREKPQNDTEIIFHCKIGKRSLKAAEAATALGFKNVKNYAGSWLDWAEREGLPK